MSAASETASSNKTTRATLRRAAASGDIAAMTALGRHLLVEPPYAALDGIRLTIEAAQKGGADAMHLLSVLAACGAGLPRRLADGARVHAARSSVRLVPRARAIGPSVGRDTAAR